MSIYTRTGDKGTTSLYGGKRVAKSNQQVEACGSIDELTSYLGLVATKLNEEEKENFLAIQKDLYKIMSCLSGAKLDLRFLEVRVKRFEEEIDRLEKLVPKLTRFILPTGTEISAWFHVLRTVCRRTERNVVRYLDNNDLKIKDLKLTIVPYLNRLSDLFFILARFHNKGKEILT